MELSQIISSGAAVTIAVTPGQLQAFAGDIIAEYRDKIQREQAAGEQYLSPAKVCELLDIDPTTLWRWDKKDLLHPIKLGGVNRYKKTDIDRILNR